MLLMLTTLSEAPFDFNLKAAAATNTWCKSTHNSQFVSTVRPLFLFIKIFFLTGEEFQGCDKLPEDRKRHCT